MQTNAENQSEVKSEINVNENFSEVIEYLKKAIGSGSDNYKELLLLASALEKTQQFDESIIAYQKVLSINPDLDYIYKKLADLHYLIKNSPIDTINYYKRFLEYKPNNNDAKSCLGVAYLKIKNYKEGWKYFESRSHKGKAICSRRLIPNNIIAQKPLWNGEDIKDKTIYVYAEAGFGDTMMFARFLTILKDRCKKVLFEPEVSNIELFKNSKLGVEILDCRNPDKYPQYDFHTPIMSLPYLLKLDTEEDISINDTYLKSNPEKNKYYKEKYFCNNDFKIGIKWHGKTNSENTRKIMLKSFYKLFDISGVKFYSVQKGDGIEELEDAKRFNIVDLGKTFNDFSDTASAIENLDLVICNDTSVAHLAGAMGKQCWILLPFAQDWRWSTDLSYCPWYKSVRLFKQKEAGNWDEVLDRVREELKKNLIVKHNIFK